MSDEYFDVYNHATGAPAGQRLRRECHADPSLLHRAVHVAVFHPLEPALLLQKRKLTKDVQPGKWDTAVGGHLQVGEDYFSGALRELAEELGVHDDGSSLEYLFDLKIRNEIESEDVRVFKLIRSGGFRIQEEEIDEIRFWHFQELFDPENRREFTPNLCVELDRLRDEGRLAL